MLGGWVGKLVLFPWRVRARLTQLEHLSQNLGAKATQLEHLSQSLGEKAALLEARLGHLGQQLDLFKSRSELGVEPFAAFQQWKASNPAPAHPLVSVCVTTYNRARLVTQRCLPSILSQTYRCLEIIVVGDGCTDDTAEAVAALRDPRVRFENLTRRGDYPAEPERRWMVAGTAPMNAALALCRGDYITHLDDDDEFLPDRIERLTRFAREQQGDFVWHPFWYEESAGVWRLNESADLQLGMVTTSAIFYRSWLKHVPSDVHAHLLLEPGDWNRIRRIKSLGTNCLRYPEPLTRHYRERNHGA